MRKIKTINFNQEFYPITDANLLFRFHQFSVYNNIPIDDNPDPEVTYLTITADSFKDVSETAVMGVRIRLGADKNYTVNSVMFIVAGEQEAFAQIETPILNTLVSMKSNEPNGTYKISAERISKWRKMLPGI